MNIRRIAGICEETSKQRPKVKKSAFLPKIQREKRRFDCRQQSYRKFKGSNTKLFQPKKSLESQIQQMREESLYTKLLPQLNLTELKAEDALFSPILISSRKGIKDQKRTEGSKPEFSQEPLPTTRGFEQSLMFERRPHKKHSLMKKIRRSLMQQKLDQDSKEKQNEEMLKHFMTISITGKEELRNSSLDSKEENKSRSFLKKSTMSTLVNKPVVLPDKLVKRFVKGRNKKIEKN
ncbi:unnamed protein product [Moneuplotes crassus]|uniref:Uncharacterized protein n=1 Tax=Euplotes crassus TaxID=5936 RepID=A0AAD1X693_EUPCR|nr:unnamed protein product [Moneuplotes crassus]